MTSTVRVRIAVAVGVDGDWQASGCDSSTDQESMNQSMYGLSSPSAGYFIEADIPLPVATTIKGEVKDA